MIIAFHGTNERAAKSIETKGFKPGTYFAKHMEDAAVYGGPYVFGVEFQEWPLNDKKWQFTLSERVGIEMIKYRWWILNIGVIKRKPSARKALEGEGR